MSIPSKLIFQHGLMLKTLLGILWQSKLRPGKRPAVNPTHFAPVTMVVPAPKTELVQHYLHWCGADPEKYTGVLPAHLFCQFALPVCAQQLRLTRYDLSGIINQGCGLTIHQPLAAGRPIKVHCELISIQEENGRARIHQRLQVCNETQPIAYEVDFHTLLIIGKRLRTEKPQQSPICWRDIGNWAANKKSGWQFALLTGDFNPLHWLTPVARFSPFGGTILHGFGSFARSFELLENQGDAVHKIDVRFTGPVKLPQEKIRVQLSEQCDSDGYYQLRQVGAKEKVQLLGRCLFR